MLNDISGIILGLITVCAILFSPLIALRVQKKIETSNDETQRKLSIFKTLLSTRANPTSFEHVQALNMIDVEFYQETDIRDRWNIYRDHLFSPPHDQGNDPQQRWLEKNQDYLTSLLYVMSKFCGYSLDEVNLKKGAYFPVAHGLLIHEQNLIRRGVAELVSGTKAVKVEIIKANLTEGHGFSLG